MARFFTAEILSAHAKLLSKSDKGNESVLGELN